ncbi:unnamed protein product [Phaedon cochleariae]|uniref:Arginyl-tRNA--protein transferase 1 n=1 Tax=Phaedon cochleariae TaxID=80249 RepID=A0A9P0GTY3_PHACE|nr:unnamed protein product [Phaedon cochleariae]
MSLKLSEISCVQWFEDIEKHRCGYCNQENTSISNGMWAHSLTVDDYQNLIDRGWRRSGMYCYKPVMAETCCPQYTIKCDVKNFSLSKSQKKVIKKFNKFLETDILNKKDISTEEGNDSAHIFIRDNPNTQNFDVSSVYVENKEEEDERESRVPICDRALEEPSQEQQDTPGETNNCNNTEKNTPTTSLSIGVGPDSSKPPCKKAKLMRLERKKEKLLKKGLTIEKKMNSNQKSIEQFLKEIPSNAKHRLKIRLIPTSIPNDEWKLAEQAEFQLYRRYQMTIHNDPPAKLELTKFRSFLVKSPIKPKEFPKDVDGPGYGSFHQQYWLEDKLIAVGVLDILPKCVSSVYFFYDPEYRSLTLGTYGSLREIELTRSLSETLPELNSYYMGFYIHSCPKMRYKGKLSPSFLLCPETYEWMTIEKCLAILDEKKYARLNENLDALDEGFPSQEDILQIRVIYDGVFMHFKDYKRMCDEPGLFKEIAGLVGKRCCRSLVFWENLK